MVLIPINNIIIYNKYYYYYYIFNKFIYLFITFNKWYNSSEFSKVNPLIPSLTNSLILYIYIKVYYLE